LTSGQDAIDERAKCPTPIKVVAARIRAAVERDDGCALDAARGANDTYTCG